MKNVDYISISSHYVKAARHDTRSLLRRINTIQERINMRSLPQTTPAECLKRAQIRLDDVARNINPETDSQALHDLAAAVSWILEYLKAQQAGKAGQDGGV